ncbi:glycosyl hydrolase [bacterium]|nr:glycosyl hydrolase [bacterium]
MRQFIYLALALLLLHFPGDAVAAVDSMELQALKYRNIGPSRGGRCSAVTGIPGQPYTFLMGNSGGVWKSVNAGQNWENISDQFFESGSIGAIAVSDSDSNVIYVGTGQTTIRGNVAVGVGVYKSTDGGKKWKHIGLRKAGQISRIRIHPNDPNLLYVAVLGNPWVPNEERGLYRSKDGGKNWEKILNISPKTGIADLAMDSNNSGVLYAVAWTAQRKPWTIISGSEESSLYKTVDGGDTWTKLNAGLPEGVVGKIGVAVSPANPDRVWALVEAEKGGLFRSDDAGQTWNLLKTNQKRRLYQRPWYYMHIFADPKDEQKVYILNVDQFRSRDGGNTFEVVDVPHGDGHDLWINPSDTRIMVMGTDGGASVTMDEGKNWSTLLNQPTAEMYYVAVDNQFPYRVYGAQQDNSTISLPSRTSSKLTPYEDWRDMGGGESGHIGFAFHSPDIVYASSYGGEITRLNTNTGEYRSVMAYPQMEVGLAPRDLRYRFNWNAPLRVSRHNPKEIYFASQFIHRSTDEGQSWQVVSPDLSRNDPSKQDYSGEPITYENTGIEVYGNVLSFEESPVRPGVFWAGSDDGLIHVLEDKGKNWRNATPSGMPEWGSVNSIEPSPHDPGRALIAVLKYKLGDFRPYLFKTDDYGKTWILLTSGKNGIPDGTPVRVVREDPARKGLLYAGTESGMFVSFDDGRNWQSLQLNLPIVPVTDLKVHQNDLVASTQGRSFWILDDLTVLHQLVGATGSPPSQEKPSLFQPRDTYRMRMPKKENNPPNGALIFYSLPENVKGEITLQISDSQGRIIQTFSSEHPPEPKLDFPYELMGSYAGDRTLAKKAGLNRFVWDLRHPIVDFPEGTIVWGFLGGVRVAPSTFQATLTVGDWKQSQKFRVLKDPRSSASQQELDEQFAFALQIRDRLNQLYHGVKTIRSVRQQARDLAKRVTDSGKEASELRKAADALWEKLSAIEDELMQPRNEADQDTENYPTKLDNQLAYVYWQLDATDSRPTDGQKERVRDLEKEIDVQLAKLKSILQTDVDVFNKLALSSGALPVMID